MASRSPTICGLGWSINNATSIRAELSISLGPIRNQQLLISVSRHNAFHAALYFALKLLPRLRSRKLYQGRCKCRRITSQGVSLESRYDGTRTNARWEIYDSKDPDIQPLEPVPTWVERILESERFHASIKGRDHPVRSAGSWLANTAASIRCGNS